MKWLVNTNWLVKDFWDFEPIKKWVEYIWDHAYICHKWDEVWEFLDKKWYKVAFLKCEATAENMCKILYDDIKNRFSNTFTDKIYKVRIYETPTSYAEFIW